MTGPEEKSLHSQTTRSVGILTALAAETRPLSMARLGPALIVRISPLALVYVGGIGPARAAEGATKLLASGAEALVSWGVAGGLDPALGPGTLMLPGHVLDERGERYESDPVWHEQLERSLAGKLTLSTGDLLTAERMIGTPSGKAGVHETTGAQGVDMESAALADVARRAGKPFIAIRAIVDPAGLALPRSAHRAVRPDGTSDHKRLLASLASRPQDLARLIRLAFCFRAAYRTLSTVVAAAGTGLLFHAR